MGEGRLTGFTLESVTGREKLRRECWTDTSRSFSDSLFVAENPRREYESAAEEATGGEKETERERELSRGRHPRVGRLIKSATPLVFSMGNPTKTDRLQFNVSAR